MKNFALLVLLMMLLACSNPINVVSQEPAEDGIYSGRTAPEWAPIVKPCDAGYWPMAAADGWKRCLPIGSFIMKAYNDAKCNTPLIASDGASVVIEGHVYQLGDVYNGPMYAMHPSCQEVPAEAVGAQTEAAGLKIYQLGEEIPLDQFRVY